MMFSFCEMDYVFVIWLSLSVLKLCRFLIRRLVAVFHVFRGVDQCQIGKMVQYRSVLDARSFLSNPMLDLRARNNPH